MAFARLGFMPGVHRSHRDEIVHDLPGQLPHTKMCSLVRSLLENSMLGECRGANPIRR
jgi:hypothetical protein